MAQIYWGLDGVQRGRPDLGCDLVAMPLPEVPEVVAVRRRHLGLGLRSMVIL